MAYEQKPGQGSLFKNDRKQTDKHPDYTGNWTNADGEKCNVAAWIKESKNGTKYMSLSIETEPYNQSGPSNEGSQEPLDNETPF